MKVIITGATGMVGEGVLFECLDNQLIDKVLIISRKHYECVHPKVEELIVPDFFNLQEAAASLAGYDACFFCAGVSSLGMKEPEYTRVTYDLTLHFAGTLAAINPGMTFCYVSGALTDSTEQGRSMWARVKGRTENDLAKLAGLKVYNFRPGFMKPFPGQRNLKSYFKVIGPLAPVLRVLMPGQLLTLSQVGRAMIHCAQDGYVKNVLEIKDIRAIAR